VLQPNKFANNSEAYLPIETLEDVSFMKFLGKLSSEGKCPCHQDNYSVLLLQVPAWWADPSKANSEGMM